MIQKIISFLDKHRILLIALILLCVVILFLGINSFIFLHHEFKPLTCTEEVDEEYCYHDDVLIFKDPETSKEAFFLKYDDEIKELEERYNLEEFNFYTAYYYLVASRLHYDTNNEYKILKEFFETYANTYNLEDYYFENRLYFNIFYNYKLN